MTHLGWVRNIFKGLSASQFMGPNGYGLSTAARGENVKTSDIMYTIQQFENVF